MSDYTQRGAYTVVPAADLLNLVSKVNVPNGDTRFHATGSAKSPGMTVLRDAGDGTYAKVRSLGATASSFWQNPNGTQYKPVNILTPGGSANWTNTNTTYSAGSFVESVAGGTSTQVVVLKAGKYRIVGTVLRNTADKSPLLTVTAATDGIVATKAFVKVPVDPAYAAPVEFTLDFTLTTASQNVTFKNNIVTTADGTTDATGSAFISYSLETQD